MKKVIRNGVFETNSSSIHSIAIKKDKSKWVFKPQDAAYFDFTMDASGVHHIDKNINRDFGWGFDYLETFTEKLYYAIAARCSDYYLELLRYNDGGDVEPNPAKALEKLAEIENAVREIYPSLTKIEIPLKKETYYVDDEGNEYTDENLTPDGKLRSWFGKDGKPLVDDKGNPTSEDVYVKPIRELDVWLFGKVDGQSTEMLSDLLKHKGISIKEFLADPRYIIIIDTDNRPKILDQVEKNIFNLADFESARNENSDDKPTLQNVLFQNVVIFK